ncbi:MAG: hypothetical protein ACOX88_02645 [Christensenellales bacterium]
MRRGTVNFILLIGLCALAVAIFCACLLPGAIISLDRLQRSSAQVDAFFSEYAPDFYVNRQAESLFEQAAREPDGEQDDPTLYEYRAPEGFYIRSQSRAWDEEKLKALYDELKKNRHGSEIETLWEIIIYPEQADNVLGTHQGDLQTAHFAPKFPALPEGFSVQFNRLVGIISLYGGDDNTTVESMARSLSHEYGHHYTTFYMLEDGDLMQSEYARIRGFDPQEVRTAMDDHYMREHHLHVIEIVAEDYVTLMGSPTTRQIVDFKDIRQIQSGEKMAPELSLGTAANAYPQENLMIPLANEIPGLDEYFYSFIDEAPPKLPPRQIVTLQIEQKSVGYNLVDGYRNYVHYKLTWNTPYPAGTVYTLVCYDESDYYIRPIKTVRSGSAAEAVVGTVAYSKGNYVYSSDDAVAEGTKTFIVTAFLPDGTIYLSQPLEYTF